MANEVNERIARLEERVNLIPEVRNDVAEIKKYLFELDKRFVTRREFGIAKWLAGTGLTILGLAVGLFEAFRR